MAADPVAFYGFTPVPRDPDVLFLNHPTASGPNPKQNPWEAKDFPFPDSPPVHAVRDFVRVRINSLVISAFIDLLLP